MSVATANGSGSHTGTAGRGAASAEHDRILSAVAQTSDDAMFTTSPDGRVTSWSGPAERLFGHSAESIIGLDVADLIVEPQRAQLTELLLRVRHGESLRNASLTGVRRDARTVDVALTLSPIALGPQLVPGVAVIARDITERNRIAAALTISEQHLRILVNSLPQMVWSSTAEGQWDFSSGRWEEFTGLAAFTRTGDQWLEQVHVDDRPLAAHTWAEALRMGADFRTQLRLRRADGDWRRFDFHGVAERTAAGEVLRWFGPATDVEDEWRTEALLRASEERLHTVLENLTEGVVVVDVHGHLLHWNRAGLIMHGFLSPTEVQRPISELPSVFELLTLDGTALALEEWPLLRLMRGEELRDVCLRYRRLDRRWERIFSYGGTTVLGPGGTPMAILTVTDVTERRRAEERFRLVVESSPMGMVVSDRDGRVSLVNSEAERLFGWNREDLLGQSVDVLLPDELRAQHGGMRRSYADTPERRPMGGGRDLLARRRNGTTCPVEIGLTPIQMHDEPSVLAVITDTSERRRAQQDLERHQRELERSNKELAQFAYVASHDLQEPLRMVASFTELFAQRYAGQVDERGARYIHHIVDGARRMQQLVRDLLSFAHVGSQGRPLARVEMQRVLTAVLHDLAPAITSAGATVKGERLPEVWADAGQLHQLLMNLVGNAIKFRRADPPEVHIRAVPDGVHWRLTVSDNGIGIAREYLERIFGMFQRLHTRDDYAGSGIGLAIARKIVERHGGRIWVESVVGEGTTVHCTLLSSAHPLPEGLVPSTQVR